MKKKYVSPTAEVEQFALTQTVAACSGIVIHSLTSECVLNSSVSSGVTQEMRDLANMGVFMTCDVEASLWDNMYDGICVHSNVNMAFTSQ